MKTRRKCRLWWANHLYLTEPSSSIFLFGWFVSSSSSSSASLDIVVAFACDEVLLSSVRSGLQRILHETSETIPISLQDKCKLSLPGHCALNLSSNSQLPTVGVEEDNQINSTHGNMCTQSSQYIIGGQWSFGCRKLDGLLDHCRMVSVGKFNYIQLVDGSHGYIGRINWIPKFHHRHWNGVAVSLSVLHVILCESPMFGSHHFSLGVLSSEQVKTPLKKPKWVEELHEKLLVLDTVVMAINSATAASLFFERLVGPERYTIRFPFVCISGSQSWMYLTLEKVFSHTWKNIQIRCCQILYWPIFLKDNDLRSQSCVEYEEKAALHRHSMWSSVAIDVPLGNILSIALFLHAESACLLVLNFVDDVTNYLLRTGCVWLMGVSAGFKLNTELAGVFGMISLNTIQIWSTIWFFLGCLFIYFVKGLAVSAVLFGLTTLASLIIHMVSLATLHVSVLHWLISHLYSQQIKAIAALWPIFRGRKWNPLCQRYDSCDYNVEQCIVGSLLFTLLLLLLPTTSVFYIFFTIMRTTVSFICISVEVIMSIIHATPYVKILLWLVRPRRFPCGIWFEIISCQSNFVDTIDGCFHDTCIPSKMTRKKKDVGGNQSTVLVSFLHSNFLNIRQIVWPHYQSIFSVVSGSFVASSAYGILTGRSILSTLGTSLPSTVPWMFIPYGEYWHICRDAVLACKPDQCDAFQ